MYKKFYKTGHLFLSGGPLPIISHPNEILVFYVTLGYNLAMQSQHKFNHNPFILSLWTADVSPRSSTLRDVSRGGNKCLHNKSGSHGVLDANLFNFTFLLVDFGKVLCSSTNELQQNSNASSRVFHKYWLFCYRFFAFRFYLCGLLSLPYFFWGRGDVCTQTIFIHATTDGYRHLMKSGRAACRAIEGEDIPTYRDFSV